MAKEVMERKASDNKYLHKDFHNIMNLGLEYLRINFGEESVGEYLRQFSTAYYKPLKTAIMEKGLAAIKEHYEKIYAIEEALDNIEITFTEDEMVVNVKKCPAVEHMKKSGVSVSPLYYEMTKTVNETICEGTPYKFKLLNYNYDTGASKERFCRK